MYLNQRKKIAFLLSIIIAGAGSINAQKLSDKIGANFWFAAGNWGEQPFRNEYLLDWRGWKIPQGVENPWHTQFLTDCHIWSILRFMDFNGTNYSTQKIWTNRIQKYHDGLIAGLWANNSIPYEWMIDLCNRTGADMWINIPHLTIDPADFPTGVEFNNEFVHKLAILLRHGIDMKAVSLHSITGGDLSKLGQMTDSQLLAAGGVRTHFPLESQLKIYVEYSNETWLFSGTKDGGTGQKDHVVKHATAMNLYNYYGAGQGFHTWAAIRCWKAFTDVFGSETQSRIVKVHAGIPAYKPLEFDAVMTQVINNPIHNPWGLKPSAHTSAYYTSAGGSCQSFVNQMTTMANDAKNTRTYWRNNHNTGTVVYEIGEEAMSGGVVKWQPCAYDAYTTFVKTWIDQVDALCFYNHGTRNKDNYGLVAELGVYSPAYNAMKDFIMANGGTRKTLAQVLSYSPSTTKLNISPASSAKNSNRIDLRCQNGSLLHIELPGRHSTAIVSATMLNGKVVLARTEISGQKSYALPLIRSARGILLVSVEMNEGDRYVARISVSHGSR